MARAGWVICAALWLALSGTASAEDVLGIPCSVGSDGVRTCTGDGAGHRVRTWDGVPLDVDVLLPPAATPGPYPTIVYLHGFGAAKGGAEPELAKAGYALVQYSARGFGNSCGLVTSRGDSGCARGWSHLADVRYEPRDTQYLLGLLADSGITDPQRIGVTGTSYGAGQSLMLATLRDRLVLPGGSMVPWRSPKGTPMRIAAAAPNWPWSDLASMLIPDGSTLDYTTANAYGPRIGVPKLSLRRAALGRRRNAELLRTAGHGLRLGRLRLDRRVRDRRALRRSADPGRRGDPALALRAGHRAGAGRRRPRPAGAGVRQRLLGG